MHFVITCNECKHSFSFPIDKVFTMDNCSNCGAMLGSDATVIDGMAEKVTRSVNLLKNVSLDGIYTGDENARARRESRNSLFSQDLESLEAMYKDASAETQDYLCRIIDTVYLLLHADTKNENQENLEQTHKQMRELWQKKFGNAEITI